MSDEKLDEIIRNAARDYNLPDVPPRDAMWQKIDHARRQAGATAMRRSGRLVWVWPSVGIAAVLVLGIGIGRVVERRHAASLQPVIAGSSTSTEATVAAAPATKPDSVLIDTSARAVGRDRTTRGSGDQPAASRDLASREGASTRPDRNVGPSHDDVTTDEGLAFRLAVLQHLAGTEAMLTTFRTEAKSGDVDARLTSWARNLLRTTHLLQASSVASNDPTLKRLLDDLELVLLQIAQYTAKSPHRAEELELIERSIDKRGVMAKLRATNPAAQMPAGT